MPRRTPGTRPNFDLRQRGAVIRATLARHPLQTILRLSIATGLSTSAISDLLRGRRNDTALADPRTRRALHRIYAALNMTAEAAALREPPTPFPATVAGRIQQICWRECLSTRALARQIGVAHSSVMAWLDGAAPTPTSVALLQHCYPADFPHTMFVKEIPSHDRSHHQPGPDEPAPHHADSDPARETAGTLRDGTR